VRDLALRQALRGLAADAGERLRGLIEAGEELPYDVTEPLEGSPFAQFAPQTTPFIRGHGTILLELDSFAPACSAIAASEAAKPYLEWVGEPIPNDPGRRAADAVLAFLCRLWEGSADFSLDERRLDNALAELEASREPPVDDEAEVVVPVLGFQMPISRLEVAGATLVRAEAVDAPGEVRAGDGAHRAAWEPLFLAAVRRPLPAPSRDGRTPPDEGPGPALRNLVTALRLFKPGGVSLGPYAWARSFSGDRWRRISTGAARARGDGYWLVESELSDLAAFTRLLAQPSTPIGPADRLHGPAASVARAVSRFEAGLERLVLLDALSDYLLALRFVLEGGGAAGVGVPMRAAALRGGPDSRPAVKATIDRAAALEEALVRGEAAPQSAAEDGSPLELVVRIESLVRAILRDAVSGALGTDPRAAADEILLADGLAAGEGSAAVRGATEEWEAASSEPPEKVAEVDEELAAPEQAEGVDEQRDPPAPAPRSRRREPPMLQQVELSESAAEEFEPELPKPDREEAEPADVDSKTSSDAGRSLASEGEEEARMSDPLQREATQAANGTWLDELDSSATLDWPERPAALRMLDQRPAERKATRDRVQHLFPRPETTEWSVGELDYERRRRKARV
jgi:hypothetical protein